MPQKFGSLFFLRPVLLNMQSIWAHLSIIFKREFFMFDHLGEKYVIHLK